MEEQNQNNLNELSINTQDTHSFHDLSKISHTSLDSESDITDNKSFIDYYLKFYSSTFIILFYQFITHIFNLVYFEKLEESSNNKASVKFQISGYNLAFNYSFFFVFSFTLTTLYVFDLEATMLYSKKKYKELGYMIHYILILSIILLIIFYVLHIFVCGVFLNLLPHLPQEIINNFYYYYFLIIVSYLFDIFFFVYSRLLSIVNKGVIVIFIVLGGILIYGLLGYFLIFLAKLGILGVLLTKIITSFLIFTMTILYVIFSYFLPNSIFFIKKESVNWGKIIELLIRYFSFIPINLSFYGFWFFSIFIASWLSDISFIVNKVFYIIMLFCYVSIEANNIALVVTSTFFIGKGASKTVVKQILGYSLIFLFFLIVGNVIIVIISEKGFISLITYDIESKLENKNGIILNDNSDLLTTNIENKIKGNNIYFVLLLVFFSFNRIFYSWFRAVDMIFISNMNPLMLGFLYKIMLAILFGKLFSIYEEGIFIGSIVSDTFGLSINILQYFYMGWVNSLFKYYSKNSVN